MVAGDLAMIATPQHGFQIPESTEWCADNGCFGTVYVGDAAWLDWLTRFPEEVRARCRFATAPDVVGDATATLERSLPYLPQIRALGYPAAFVAQNGLEDLEVPWDEFDALFLGGDTEWKLGPHARNLAHQAHVRGKWVHMGRVNSHRRMRHALAIGCDSADGTFLAFGPDRNLPELIGWLRSVNHPTLIERIAAQ